MDPVLRTELKQRFIEHSEEFDLPNALVNTFVRQLDAKTQVTAIDMVYAISSILESPQNLSRKDFSAFIAATEEQKRQAE